MKPLGLTALILLGLGCTPRQEPLEDSPAESMADASRGDQSVRDAALIDALLPDAGAESDASADTSLPDAAIPDAAIPDAAIPTPVGLRRIAGSGAQPVQFNEDATVLLFLQDASQPNGGDSQYWLHHGPTDARLNLGIDALTRVQLAADGRSVYWYHIDRADMPRAGIIIWSPGLMDADVRIDLDATDTHEGYLLGGGRYLLHNNIVSRIEADGLVEILRWPPAPILRFATDSIAPTLAMVHSSDEHTWLVNFETGQRRQIRGGGSTVAWTPNHLVYEQGGTRQLMLWAAATDQLSPLTVLPPPPQGDWQVVASTHQPPIMAYASSAGLRTERAGSNIVEQQIAAPSTIIGWDGDWIIAQTPVGGEVSRINALTGERLIVEGIVDRRIIQPTRHSAFLLSMLRGEVERWAWATNERIALGELRGVRDTQNPDLFYNRGRPELYRIVDGQAVVDPGAINRFSPDESLIALDRIGDLTVLDVPTLAERSMYPQGLPDGPLQEWVLGNGMMALRVGANGESSLWLRPAR